MQELEVLPLLGGGSFSTANASGGFARGFKGGLSSRMTGTGRNPGDDRSRMSESDVGELRFCPGAPRRVSAEPRLES